MLSWPYAHLLINHFPVVLSISALAVTVLALLLGRRGLWLTAMAALTAAGALIYPVHFTGDRADHALEDPWYIHSGTIEAHDDAAGIAMAVILVVALSQEARRSDSGVDAGGRGSRRSRGSRHRDLHRLPRREDHPRGAHHPNAAAAHRTSARHRRGAPRIRRQMSGSNPGVSLP